MTRQNPHPGMFISYTSGLFFFPDAGCEISYEAVGCYGEVSSNRAFTKELVNEVKPFSRAFNGVIMEFGNNWEEGFKKFLCRCARAAHLKRYTMFGVHEHGEFSY